MNAEILPYNDSFKSQIISVWESSVRATHHFLTETDINFYKKVVLGFDFNAFQVFCLVKGEQLIGFIGVANRKIEMLFLSPESIGKGFGKLLIEFAIHKLKANEVDVNEQNQSAIKFYKKFGFVQFERTELDDAGKNYPLLKMKLKKLKTKWLEILKY